MTNRSKHPEHAELIWAHAQWLLEGQKVLHQWHQATLEQEQDDDE